MSKTIELRVKVTQINEAETVGNNGTIKRTMEGIIEGEYPETYQFEFINDKADLLDDLIEGAYATVFFNIRSRKVTENKDGVKYDKPIYFTNLNAWKVEI